MFNGITISVTKNHIDSGVKLATTSDAVSLAIKEKLPGAQPWIKWLWWRLEGQIVLFISGKQYVLDSKVQNWIKDWDKGRKVQPFQFTLKEI